MDESALLPFIPEGGTTQDVPVYHLTHVDNLDSIIQQNGLICRNRMARFGIDCDDVSLGGAQAPRSRRKIGLYSYGSRSSGGTYTVHDFAPFFFCPRPPMLWMIHGGRVAGYSQGQDPLVYLVSTLGDLRAWDCEVAFVDGYAGDDRNVVFCAEEFLPQSLDWGTMTNWRSYDAENWHRTQAECLALHRVPLYAIRQVVSRSSATAHAARSALEMADHDPDVIVEPTWFF